MVKPKNTNFRLGAAKVDMLLLKNIPNPKIRLRKFLYKKVNQWENRVNYTPELRKYWHGPYA